MLRVSALTKSYEPRHVAGCPGWPAAGPSTLTALDGVDLDAAAAARSSRWSASPAPGKSTLAKILVGSTTADQRRGLARRRRRAPPARDRESSRRVQMVFQDPYSSLNPRLTVGRMLAELLLLHKIVPASRGAGRERAAARTWWG